MTANDASRYQILLQVAAETRRRAETEAVNITYTASVAAVQTSTPSPSQGSTCIGAEAYRMPMPRDATIAIVASDAVAWNIMSIFAVTVSGIVSVGLKAVAFVNAT
jgi:hypothetical protein